MLFFLARLFGLRRSRLRAETAIGIRLRRSGIVLLWLLAMHVVAMLVFEREQLGAEEGQHLGHAVLDAIWLTLTTVMTVGYGDISAATPAGKISTMLLLYTAAIFIAANIGGLAVERKLDRISRMRDGTWRWNMRDHIVILNAPFRGAERYFVRFLTELRADPRFADIPVLIVTDQFDQGLPEPVRDLGVGYVKGTPHDIDVLRAAGVVDAAYVVILAADEVHPRSDSLNFDVLLEVHEMYTSARIIAEVVETESRDRFHRFGAHRLLRPIRAYPELMVRTITTPGAEVVFEDLLQTFGTNATRRYHVRIDRRRWADVVSALLSAGHGTAIAYVDESRQVVSNPPPDAIVDGRGLILLGRGTPPNRSQVQLALDALAPVG